MTVQDNLNIIGDCCFFSSAIIIIKIFGIALWNIQKSEFKINLFIYLFIYEKQASFESLFNSSHSLVGK